MAGKKIFKWEDNPFPTLKARADVQATGEQGITVSLVYYIVENKNRDWPDLYMTGQVTYLAKCREAGNHGSKALYRSFKPEVVGSFKDIKEAKKACDSHLKNKIYGQTIAQFERLSAVRKSIGGLAANSFHPIHPIPSLPRNKARFFEGLFGRWW